MYKKRKKAKYLRNRIISVGMVITMVLGCQTVTFAERNVANDEIVISDKKNESGEVRKRDFYTVDDVKHGKKAEKKVIRNHEEYKEFIETLEEENIRFEDVVDVKIEQEVDVTDDFEDDRVLVTLRRDYSDINKVHTLDEFETDILKVSDEDMSDSEDEDIIRMTSVRDLVYIEGDVESNDLINKDNFNQILEIQLQDTGKENVLEAIEELETLDCVLAAEVDTKNDIKVQGVSTNDTYSGSQWALSMINMEQAWAITRGDSNIRIGVMDTGIYAHEDLDAHVLKNLETAPVDTNQEKWWHGTNVASIIGAVVDNGKGVAGVVPNISLISIRDNLIFPERISYAASNGVEILNASFCFEYPDGTPMTTCDSTYINAVKNFDNILLVCGASNDGCDIDNSPRYPACIPCSNVISVGASTSSDTIRSTSNYGYNNVDLFAPGEGVWCADPRSGYIETGGTSIAAPHVSGVAALMKSVNPNLTPELIREILIDTVDKNNNFSGKCWSGGRLNAYKAVLCAKNITDGSFIECEGRVYRIAGGAPLYVSSWDNVGGFQSYYSISRTVFDCLNKYPKDGTFISAGGRVYRFAGGAPIYVTSFDKFAGESIRLIQVDQIVVNQYSNSEPLNHVRQYPVDGTFVRTNTDTYVFAGGAPIYVKDFTHVNYTGNSILVDDSALKPSSSASPWNHVRMQPKDGTFVEVLNPEKSTSTKKYYYCYIFAGGAPIYISDWNKVNYDNSPRILLDYEALESDLLGGSDVRFSHVNRYPANNTFVQTKDGKIYNFAGGTPFYVTSMSKVNYTGQLTVVDSSALEPSSSNKPWNHVRETPLDGTFVYTNTSGSYPSTVFCYQDGIPQSVFSAGMLSSIPSANKTMVDMYRKYKDAATLENPLNWNIMGMPDKISLNLRESDKVDYIKFIAPTTGSYSIYSSYCTGNIKGAIYNSVENLAQNRPLVSHDDISSTNRNFKITVTLTAGKVYYLKIQNYSSSTSTTGSYVLNIDTP